MGIQSTIKLTREEAEKRYVRKMLQDDGDLQRKLRSIAVGMSDEELEDKLEEFFNNFMIVSNDYKGNL